MASSLKCSVCSGTGKVDNVDELCYSSVCSMCEGSGRVQVKAKALYVPTMYHSLARESLQQKRDRVLHKFNLIGA